MIPAGEVVLADRAADLLEHLGRLALGVQGLARFAAKGLPAEHGLDPVQFFLVVGNRREAHDLPRLLRQHVTGDVILVQSVHDQDDGIRQLVVQPAVEGVVVPFVGPPALRLRQGFLGLQWIVDDDDIGTPPGQHPADRGGHPAALRRRFELRHRLMPRRETRREEPLVPVGGDNPPAVARQFVGEVLGIARTDNLRARVVAEKPRRAPPYTARGNCGLRSDVKSQVPAETARVGRMARCSLSRASPHGRARSCPSVSPAAPPRSSMAAPARSS
jgi:hypothetical protein